MILTNYLNSKQIVMAELPNRLDFADATVPRASVRLPSMENPNPNINVPGTHSVQEIPSRQVKLRSTFGYNLIIFRDDGIQISYENENSMDQFIDSMFYSEIAFLDSIKNDAKLEAIPITILPPNVPERGPQCAISYDEIIKDQCYDICTTCNNVFKSEYLTQWIKQSCTCPTCRSPIQERTQSKMP